MYTFVNREHTHISLNLGAHTHTSPVGGAHTSPLSGAHKHTPERGMFVFMSWDYCFSHCFSRKNSRIQYPIIRRRKIPPAITTAIFQTPRRVWWIRVSMGRDHTTVFPRRTLVNNPWWTAVWKRHEPHPAVTPFGPTVLLNTSRRISVFVAGPTIER